MLFRTVYGPELEPIYNFIKNASIPLRVEQIYAQFLWSETGNISTQSVDDAIAFLVSSNLVLRTNDSLTVKDTSVTPFRLKLLSELRTLATSSNEHSQKIDCLYLYLLDSLYILPNQLYQADVHLSANSLPDVIDLGGLSKEKINSWQRVIQLLGLGYRAYGGFLCCYHPQLLTEIINQMPEDTLTIQDVITGMFSQYLPCLTVNGELSYSISEPLLYLQSQGLIDLFPMQDSPSRSYFGHLNYKGIERII